MGPGSAPYNTNMKIELDIECKACGATGLYVGMAERDGAAVVCHTCKGTGRHKYTFEYTPFSARKPRLDVCRVIEVNPGITVGDGNGHRIEDFGGMSHDDWERGAPFTQGMEMRRYTCPAWWYQSTDYNRKPEWDECIVVGTFSSCAHFKCKEKCWERFDREASELSRDSKRE